MCYVFACHTMLFCYVSVLLQQHKRCTENAEPFEIRVQGATEKFCRNVAATSLAFKHFCAVGCFCTFAIVQKLHTLVLLSSLTCHLFFFCYFLNVQEMFFFFFFRLLHHLLRARYYCLGIVGEWRAQRPSKGFRLG